MNVFYIIVLKTYHECRQHNFIGWVLNHKSREEYLCPYDEEVNKVVYSFLAIGCDYDVTRCLSSSLDFLKMMKYNSIILPSLLLLFFPHQQK